MIPGTGKLVCILGTHHGSLGGALAVIDPSQAIDGHDSIERTWPAKVKGRFRNLEMLKLDKEKRRHRSVWKAYNYWPEETVELAKKDPNLRIHRWEDSLGNVKPWYDTPWPLTDRKTKNSAGKYFLCARAEIRGKGAAIYLIDVFGNEIKIHQEGPGCYSPMSLAPTPKPVNMPPRRDYGSGNGYFYVQNVYEGTHMKGVKKDSVKYLRVVETPDKAGFSGGSWNCLGSQSPGVNWSDFNTKRILGTVPVAKDGSAYFAVPSDRFVHFQLLDKNGMMIQTMRGGTSIHSGETQGCVGCHESRLSTLPTAGTAPPKSLRGKPAELKPWYGSTRRFSYMKEVQPVFDRHCVKCHDFGKKGAKKVILSGDRNLMFNYSYGELWYKGYVGAIGAGPAGHLPPYAWGSHKSRLIQHILKGHKKVKLSTEEMNRLITWVDINGPYYPTTVSSSGGGGRSANRRDIGPIMNILGIRVNALFHTDANKGPLVNIDRPELSPCLSKLEKGSDKYNKLLLAIQNIQKNVQKHPRGDVMEGLVPHRGDAGRITHRKKYREYEMKVSEAIRTGKIILDSEFANQEKQ